MNQDLMLAVLAMDAYNTKGSVGTAVNLNIFISPEMLAAGFSAQAYTYNGETIISFRGTDPGWAAVNDIFNGWSGGAGVQSTQAGLAAQFYQSVVGSAAFPFSTNVTFTGHSLGGGLAGLLAGLYGKQAVVFDNMAYSSAIANTYWDATHPTYPGTIDGITGLPVVNESHAGVLSTFYGGGGALSPNTSGISGYQLSGQILQTIGQSTGAVVGSEVDWGVGGVDKHSQALLVLNMYAEQQTGLDPAWKDVAEHFGQELFAQDAVTNIAYSVVSEGVRPRGDAAAHSMFDDAADVANFIAIEGSSYLFYNSIEPAWDLAEIAVQFAKRQADAAVIVSSMGNESGGIFHASEAGLFLSLDATAKAWGDVANISGWESIKALTLYGLQVENQEALASEALSVMNEVDFALFSSGGTVDVTLDGENPMVFAGQIQNVENAASLVFGTDVVDTIKGGKGNDFLIGGGGADTLIGGDGKDALFGGADADLLIQGTLEDKPAGSGTGGAMEVVEGGAGTDYIVLTDADTDHVTIRDGDTDDRLLLMPHLGGKTAGADGSLPFTALVGAAVDISGIYYFSFDGDPISSEPATNIFVHEDGRKTKDYGYSSEDGNFGVTYAWYFEESLLEISVNYTDGPDSGKEFKITIEDFSEGDYGISLTTYHVSDRFEYDDSNASNTVIYAAAQAAFDKKISELRDEADKYTLTKDYELQQQARMFADFSAAAENDGPSVLDATNIVMRLDGGVSDDTLDGNDLREKLFGYEGADRINAGGGDDVLEGGEGNDTLYGEEGADELFGAAGADRLIGGQGADQLDGGAGVDTADYRTSAAAVQVNLLAQSGLGGDAEGDTLVFIENLAGSNFGDVLTGDDAINRLQGFNGNDQLLGGGGNDRLLGGLGADVINGGDGVDTADYSTSLAAVQVNLKLNVGQGAEAAGDSFIAIENLSGSDFGDTLTGDDLNNRLSGVDGNDTLSGLGGIDYLVGGSGNDVMTGGAGADVFVFNLGSGRDTITDFWAGTGRTDRIQFVDGQLGTFAGVIAQAANTSAGVVITLSADDSLTFSGLQISQLRADDFLFA
jgi:Ca2+-binding RTX toxin-like protein